MATYNVWRSESSITTSGYYFLASINFSVADDELSIGYAVTSNYNGGTAPWTVTLYQSKLDFFGNVITAPTAEASYTVPAKDATTGAIFPFHYDSVLLASAETGLFWTAPVEPSYANDETVLKFAGFNETATTQTSSTIQLALNGTTAPVTDLYDVGIGATAGFGGSFVVAYSTYNPGNHVAQIRYEHFSDAGTPLNGGLLVGFSDGYAHGVDFGTFDSALSPFHTPDYALMYFLPVGTTAGVHVLIQSADGATTLGSFDILDYGPNGETSSGVEDYGFAGRSATDSLQQYGIFTQTFFYTDANSNVHEQVGIETVSNYTTTGATISARTQFNIPSFQKTGVGIARVLNGDFVIAYSDGGQTYLREYTSGLTQIGATFAVPDDTYGFSNLVSLGDGRVYLEWRTASGSQLNSIIYDTRTAGMTITPATTAPVVAGTTFNDTINQVGAAQTVDGGGGTDTYAVTSSIGQSTVTIDTAGDITVTTPTATDDLTNIATLQFSDATLSILSGTTAGTDATSATAFNLGHAGTTLALSQSLTYGGSVALTGAVTLNVAGFTLTLTGPVTFAASGTATPTVTGTGGTLTTNGSTSLGGLTLVGTTTWQNNGTVTATGGLAIIEGPGLTGTLVNAATGTYNLAGDVGITGSGGTQSFTNAGTLAKTGGSGVSSIMVNTTDTGTLSVSGGNLRFFGAQNSFAGTYIGPAMIDYGAGSTDALGTIAMTAKACSTNFGTVNQNGVVTVADGSTITNLSGSSWNFTGNNGFALASGSSSPLFTNKGTLAKTGGTGTTAVAISVLDGGVTTIAVGTLSFTGPSSGFGGAISGAGTFAIGGGTATISTGTTIGTGAFAIKGGASVTLAEALSFGGTFTTANGTTLTLGGNTLTLGGVATVVGTIAGPGTLTVTGALEVAGAVNGGAVLQIGTGGKVTLDTSQSGATISFGAGAQTVTVKNGATLGDTIAGFAAGDAIDLAGLTFSAAYETVFTASSGGGTLTIVDTGHSNAVVGTYALSGSYGNGVFTLAADSGTGTTIGFTATPNLGVSNGIVVTANIPGGAPLAIVDQYNSDGSLYLEDGVSKAANGNYTFHYAGGSFFTGKAFQTFDNVTNAAGTLLTQTLYNASGFAYQQSQFNANGSLYLQDTVTTLSNGNIDTHFQNGSFFNGKAFAAFDNVTTPSGTLVSQTLDDSTGFAYQQTQFNANGSIYLTDTVSKPAAGQLLYHFSGGSFFTGKSFSAFDNLDTTNNTLLAQELYNTDGSHGFTVPGDNLTLTAAKNDTFNVTGSNETTRFNATGFGTDLFKGYAAGDVFSFATSIFPDYATLSQHVSGSSSAVITTAANDTLTLNGVAAGSLTSSMFKFA